MVLHTTLRRASWLALLAAGISAQSWLPTSYEPPWATAPVLQSIPFAYDDGATPLQNGARLVQAIDALLPGDELVVGPGTYSMLNRFEIALQGTPRAPIRIVAADLQDRPVITRQDAAQNALNVGQLSGVQARYLLLRGLDVTGGADLLRLYDCQDVWIDRCYLHDGQGVGLAANSNDVSYLWVTDCEIARPATANPVVTGEGMYLGQNDGVFRVSWSVIARNYVHETQVASPGPGYQGDGIELKQGSHHNWIVENIVRGTRLPCLLVDGTGDASAPDGENVIERNVLVDAQDSVLQVQGDAIVRNNIVVYSQAAHALASFSHQGPVRNLRVVHNTFLNPLRAANLSGWADQPGMVFANNVCYSQGAQSINLVGGSSGVEMAGNVVVGPVVGGNGGWSQGATLFDFQHASWTGEFLDVRPRTGRRIDNRGSWAYREPVDLFGVPRLFPVDAGAVENAPAATADVHEILATAGGVQTLSLDVGPVHAGKVYFLVGTVSGTGPPFQAGGFDVPLVVDGWTDVTLGPNVGPLVNTLGTLDAQGRAQGVQLLLPPVPGLELTFHHAFTVWIMGTSSLEFVGNPVLLLYR